MEKETFIDRHGNTISRKKLKASQPLHRCIMDDRIAESECLSQVRCLLQDGVDVDCLDHVNRTPLMIACSNELLTITECLLYHKTDVSLVDKVGNNVLHYIAKHKYNTNIALIGRIFDSGVNIDMPNFNGVTPFHRAVDSGNQNVILFLINSGCNLNPQTVGGGTPLHRAVCNNDNDIVKILINAGCNVNIKTNIDETPLFKAVCNNNDKITKMLLDAGCNVNIQTIVGETALYKAVQNSNDDIFHMLLNTGCDVDIKTKTGSTPLFVSVYQNNDNIAMTLIEAGSDVNITYKGETLLNRAIRNDNHGLVKMLIEANCNINYMDKNGRTALIQSIENYLIGKINITHLLLDAGCDVVLSSKPGLEVLRKTVEHKNKDLILLLIKHRADVLTEHEVNMLQFVDFILRQNDFDLLDFSLKSGLYVDTFTQNGENIVHLIAKSNIKNLNYNFDVLLNNKLDVNHRNKFGDTPLMVTASSNNATLLQFFMQRGCDVNIQNNEGKTPIYGATLNNNSDVVNMLINHRCDVDISTDMGETPIYQAVQNNNVDIVKILINAGCHLNMQMKTGETPLHKAVYLQNQEIVNILIDAGCDVNIVNNIGRTPLYMAVCNNSENIVTRLIDAGCDVNIVNNIGRTPLYMAVCNNNDEIVKTLCDNGSYVNIKYKGEAPLHRAIIYNNTTLVKILIIAGCNVNLANRLGSSPFILSLSQYLNGNVSITHLLLDADCDVKLSGEPGLKILQEIVKHKNESLIQLLIKLKADMLTEHEDNSLQFVSMILEQNDLELLQFSLISGIYVDTLTKNGENVLHLLAKTPSEHLGDNFDSLLYTGLDINLRNKKGNTPLMVAALSNNQNFSDYLIKQGCDVNIQNKKGNSALHMSVRRRRWDTKVLEFLLATGTDVNLRNKDGQTALMLAANEQTVELLQKLINAGAVVALQDNQGRSALQYLDIDSHFTDMYSFKLLLSHGGLRVLNLSNDDDVTIIQSVMLFQGRPVWHWENTLHFIRFLVAMNVSLQTLQPVYDTNYNENQSLSDVRRQDVHQLRRLLYLSGAPVQEILTTLYFNSDDTGESHYPNDAEKFCLFRNNLSLKTLSRRVIRQHIGVRINEKVLELGFPKLVQEFIMLKDVLLEKYYELLDGMYLYEEEGYDEFSFYDTDD